MSADIANRSLSDRLGRSRPFTGDTRGHDWLPRLLTSYATIVNDNNLKAGHETFMRFYDFLWTRVKSRGCAWHVPDYVGGALVALLHLVHPNPEYGQG